MPHNELRPLLVRMPAELHDKVSRIAEREDRSMAQVMRVAVRDYVAKSERRAAK